MIVGIGNDIIEIARVRAAMEQPAGGRFVERILTPAERGLLEARKGRRHEFAAGRFAAKEALAKALGCGIGRQVGFQDMEIMPDEQGKPQCGVSPEALRRLGYGPDELAVHLSISHSGTTAAAFAVIERRVNG